MASIGIGVKFKKRFGTAGRGYGVGSLDSAAKKPLAGRARAAAI
jgi:hypothetical protein